MPARAGSDCGDAVPGDDWLLSGPGCARRCRPGLLARTLGAERLRGRGRKPALAPARAAGRSEHRPGERRARAAVLFTVVPPGCAVLGPLGFLEARLSRLH